MEDTVQAPASVRIELPVRPAALTRALIAISAGFVAVSTVVGVLVYRGSLDESRVVRWLSVDEELSIPTWFSSSMLLVAAALALTVAWRTRQHARLWAALGALLLAMSLEEVVGFHEQIGERIQVALDTGGFLRFAFVIPGTILAIVAVLLFADLVRSLDPTLRKVFVVAVVLYFGATLGLESIGGALTDANENGTILGVFETNLEELFEMVGISLLLYPLAVQAGRLGADRR